jgi:catechol 2,3-dioxygenase-like lactoylglutathione lyase family enzyme
VAPALVPELEVSDLAASLAFYLGVCGFAVAYERPEDRFACLQRGGAELMLEQAGPVSARGLGMNLQIEVSDVDGLHDRVVRAGSKVVRELEERWYRRGAAELGNRQFVVADPDGYLLRFFQDLGERSA